MSSKGTNTSSSQSKNGTPFPRACPKCNIHFNLLDPLKNHMKVKLFQSLFLKKFANP
ncbi:zinc finger protein 280D [Phyllostomus discolor]|uniref:Zinc finger protein 280D n=1 Tax=Phyllostomus discolor TaxID=89673 RepID=A0A834BRT3_9CHIR|nr:zinc finger protein 280D [Phyllostomus discolor]